MKILKADYLLTPTQLLENRYVVYDKTIHSILTEEELNNQYNNAEVVSHPFTTLVTPGLVNAHVHLEFSSNKDSLHYGNFMEWLQSVIAKREDIITQSTSACIEEKALQMLRSGTTAFGAVSSYGLELEAIENIPQKVVFFNELIGSQANMADVLYNDFLERLKASENSTKSNLSPAIAIHSPYSVHPILIKKALQLSKEKNYLVSAHFLESQAELEWLKHNSGEFKAFFQSFLNQESATNTIEGFLELFEECPVLLTHSVYAVSSELERIKNGGHKIIHCPISNRLLGNKALDIAQLEAHGIEWMCATDGLSSNFTLNLFEELKAALFIHNEANLETLSKKVFESSTKIAAEALRLNCGTLQSGKDADFLLFEVSNVTASQLYTHLILQNYPLKSVTIEGNEIIV